MCMRIQQLDVIAAHKITSPKKRYPICPAPCKNASAVGFAGSSGRAGDVAVATTTPKPQGIRYERSLRFPFP